MGKWDKLGETPRPVNYIAFVVDESGSMSHLANNVRRSFDDIRETISRESVGQETLVSLYKVNDTVRSEFERIPPEDIRLSYAPGGMTPLNDGIGTAISQLENNIRRGAKDVSFLVVVLTDGIENASRGPFANTYTLRGAITARQATDKWTFVFQVPPGTKAKFARDYGVEPGNIREWEPTERGYVETVQRTNVGTQHYFQARSKGVSSVKSFYTDLSGVSQRDVQSTLNDLQWKFSTHQVPWECEIRSFVEAETGRPYQIGSAFYQLMKPELVQAGKQILLREKGKKAVWGGAEARNIVGIPLASDARLKPGNHANYDLFVQSMSTNRKLVRGTTVLIEKR